MDCFLRQDAISGRKVVNRRGVWIHRCGIPVAEGTGEGCRLHDGRHFRTQKTETAEDCDEKYQARQPHSMADISGYYFIFGC